MVDEYQRGRNDERKRIIEVILKIPLPKKSWYEDYRLCLLLYAKEILKQIGYENYWGLYLP